MDRTSGNSLNMDDRPGNFNRITHGRSTRRRRGNSLHLFFATCFALMSVLIVRCSAWVSQGVLSFPHVSIKTVQQTRIPAFLVSKSSLDPSDAFSSTKPPSDHPSLIDAAASVTQDSCLLLGVKSIGVDYGLVRTGVAVTVGYSPKALAILSDLNATQVCDEVIRIARAEQASKIIVGLPLHKNGTVAEQTNLTLVFVHEMVRKSLQCLGPAVSVELWDERYTSKEAAARAHSRDPGSFLHGTLDAEAACIILENYYSENGQGAYVVELSSEERDAFVQVWERQKELEQGRLQAALDERELKMQRRKEAIARNQKLEAEMAMNAQPSKKKKKKKRKKR